MPLVASDVGLLYFQVGSFNGCSTSGEMDYVGCGDILYHNPPI